MKKTHGKILFFERNESLYFCYEEQNGVFLEHKFTKKIPIEKLNIQEKGAKAVDVFVKRALSEHFKKLGIISEASVNFRKPFVK